jgi:hypothetical protein
MDHLLNANASRYNAEHNVQASQPMVPSVIGQFAADPEQRAELGSLQVALGPQLPSIPASNRNVAVTAPSPFLARPHASHQRFMLVHRSLAHVPLRRMHERLLRLTPVHQRCLVRFAAHVGL